MWRKSIIRVSVIALTVITLTACYFDGDSSRKPAVGQSAGGSPSLGLITNATVNFYQADGTTLIDSGDTGTSGVVTVNAGSYNGPVVVEVLGDDIDAMYFDEALATVTRAAPNQSLSSRKS